MKSGDKPLIPTFGTCQDDRDYTDRPGVYALIENNDRQIAVIQTRNGFFLPGGGMDIGESDVDALKREILEETGYQASVFLKAGETVEYIEAFSDKKYYRIHSTFYKVQLGSRLQESKEKDHQLVWLSPEDAVRLLKRRGQVWAVQRLLKG